MMDELVERVYGKIKDFRKDEGVTMSCDAIRQWALQFGEDAEFMLSETDNILGAGGAGCCRHPSRTVKGCRSRLQPLGRRQTTEARPAQVLRQVAYWQLRGR